MEGNADCTWLWLDWSIEFERLRRAEWSINSHHVGYTLCQWMKKWMNEFLTAVRLGGYFF